MSTDGPDTVIVKVELTEGNLDKLFLSAASGQETATEAVNRAIAFYHAIMEAKPGTVISWKFVDGSRGRLRRLH